MIVLIAPVTSVSVSVSTYSRRGSGPRLRPAPIPPVIPTLPSILVSVLGTVPGLGTLPRTASISSISVPRSTTNLVPIAISLIAIVPSVIQSMVVPIVISVTVSISGPTAVSVIGPIISIITFVTIVLSSSVAVLIPISAIQPISGVIVIVSVTSSLIQTLVNSRPILVSSPI